MTAEQIRAARAMLRWKQSDLASSSRVSEETIKRLEKMSGPLLAVNASTIAAIESAFKREGIEFLGETGVGMIVKD
ncbi:transcriptional regulator [Brucella lupini]